MRYKIIKRFLASVGSICVLYGSVTAFASMMPENEIIPPITVSEPYDEVTETETGYSDKPPQTEEDTENDTTVPEEPETGGETTTTEAAEPETETDEETVVAEESEEPAMSLSEYLSTLHCTGCGRRCSLLYPSCGRGQANSNSATTEYYAVNAD